MALLPYQSNRVIEPARRACAAGRDNLYRSMVLFICTQIDGYVLKWRLIGTTIDVRLQNHGLGESIGLVT